MLYVSAELVELKMHIPAHPDEDVDDAADGIYGDEDPDYLVLMIFNHAGHPKEGPPTWRGVAVADNLEDPDALFPGDEYNPDQWLYDADKDLNRFDQVGSKTEKIGDETIRPLPGEQFMLSGPDGYDHVQCAPRQEMTVRIVVVESDNDSWGPTVLGQVLGGVAGTGVSTLASAKVGALVGSPGGPAGVVAGGVAGTTISWLVSMGSEKGIESLNVDDVVAHGAGTLNPNGRTEITLVNRSWLTSPALLSNRSSAYPRLGEEVAVDPGDSVVSAGTRMGTVVGGEFRDEPGSPRDGESVTGRVLVEEDRGTAVFRTTTFPVTGVFDRFINAETLVDGRERAHVCAHWEKHGPPPSFDYRHGWYDHSRDAMVALAAVAREEPIPVEAAPAPVRGLLANQRAVINVGNATMGVETGPDGQIASLTAGPIENPRYVVEMTPEVAYDIVYSEQRGETVREKLAAGEITYRAVRWQDRLVLGGLNAGLVGLAAYDHLAIRAGMLLPSPYDTPPGTTTQVQYRGSTVTLSRNQQGVRALDTGTRFVPVVTRTGEQFGVTTMGAQRLIDAPTPAAWESVSGPTAGVYARQSTQAVQARQDIRRSRPVGPASGGASSASQVAAVGANPAAESATLIAVSSPSEVSR